MGMFSAAVRYPLSSPATRDSLAAGSALVLAALVLVRVGRALWPDALALPAFVLAAVPAVLFAGLVGRVIDPGDDGPPRLGLGTVPFRSGIAVLVATVVYLVGPVAVLLVTVVGLQGAADEGIGQVAVAVAGTSAMILTLGMGYALPAALAVTSREGLRSGLAVRSLPGLRSGAYFAAWAGASVLALLGWAGLGVGGRGTALAALGAVWFAYAHLAAARLVREGMVRATGQKSQ
jgi:hypothetical protein